MDRAQTRFTGTTQVFNGVFDEYSASGVNALVRQNMSHQGHRGFWAKVAMKLHLLDAPKAIKAAQNPKMLEDSARIVQGGVRHQDLATR